MIIDKQKAEELKAQFPRMEVHDGGTDEEPLEVAFRPPSQEEWRRWKVEVSNESGRAMATETLVTNCVICPNRQEYVELLKRFPGLTETFADAVLGLAGVRKGGSKKKAI